MVNVFDYFYDSTNPDFIAFPRPSQNYLTSQERTLALQNSTSLRVLYDEVFRSNTAILLQTHRIRLNRYNHCFVATELIDWLIAHKKAANRYKAFQCFPPKI